MKEYKIIFSAFVFFYTMFFKWSTFDPTFMGWINNGLILSFIAINYPIFKKIFKPEYRTINLFVLLWGAVVIYSAYQNQNLTYDVPIWNSVTQRFDFNTRNATRYDHSYYYVIKILMSVLYFEYLNLHNKASIFIKYLLIFMTPFVIISDINGFIYQSSGIDGYLAGNKFYVCYLNIFLATIYYLQHPTLEGKSKYKMQFLLLTTFLLSLKTQCSTMVIGTIVYYYLIFYWSITKRGKLYKAKTFLTGLFICDILFFFIVTLLLQIPLIQFIVVDVLGEDLTLTGRIGMYASLGEVLSECPFYGFGLGNASLATTMYMVGDNAQNGFLNLFLEIGFLGVFLFYGILLLMMRKAKSNKTSYSLICFIYTMLILSSIEITFTTYFFAMSILFLLRNTSTSNTLKNSPTNYNKHENCRNYNCTPIA